MKHFGHAAGLAGTVLLLAVSAGGCFMPAFDEVLSTAYFSARKMRHDVTIGPYRMWEGDFSRYSDVRFLPHKMQNPNGGVLAKAGNGGLDLAYIDRSSGNWNVQTSGGTGPFTWISNSFNYAAAVLEPGVMALFRHPASSSNMQSDYMYVVGPPPSFIEVGNITSDMAAAIQANFVLGSPPAVIGANYWSDSLVNTLALQTLSFESGLYYETLHGLEAAVMGYSSWSSINLARFGADGMPLPFPVAPANGCYFYSPATDRSYLSTWVTNRWVTYCWYHDAGLQFRQLPVVGRLSAVFSSGELYVESGSSGEIYGPDGVRKYSIPLGGMRLAHEMYENGAYRLVFVQRLMFNDNSGEQQGQWEVYSIPTADLKNLD